jgi:hypothetical protein
MSLLVFLKKSKWIPLIKSHHKYKEEPIEAEALAAVQAIILQRN